MSGLVLVSRICATMIVRDEEATLRRCLDSLEALCDAFVLVDTGSTDRTREIASEWLSGHEGELHERPWTNFAHNRTEALELARPHGDYLLSADADYTFAGEIGELEHGAYLIRYTGPVAHELPLLFRADLPWRYSGAVHESLVLDSGDATLTRLDTLTVTHHGDGGSREGRLERDAAALNEALGGQEIRRNTYYLAQTYRDMGQLPAAIDLYARRSRMGGFEEEAWHARYQEGLCRLKLADDLGVAVLLEAFQRRPHRAEPLRALASHLGGPTGAMLTLHADTIEYPSGDVLFIETNAYRDPS